jgi:hypothetical protein
MVLSVGAWRRRWRTYRALGHQRQARQHGATGASGPNGNQIAPCGCHASNNTYILSVPEALHLG